VSRSKRASPYSKSCVVHMLASRQGPALFILTPCRKLQAEYWQENYCHNKFESESPAGDEGALSNGGLMKTIKFNARGAR